MISKWRARGLLAIVVIALSVALATSRHHAWASGDEAIEIVDEVLMIEPVPAGQRVILSVEPGNRIQLSDPQFDPRVTGFLIDGDDLVIDMANGGMLVLEGFFTQDDNAITILDGPWLSAKELLDRVELTQSIVPGDEFEEWPVAAAAPAKLVALLGWFVDFLGPSPASAAQAEGDSALPADPILEQLLAQIEIARTAASERHFATYLAEITTWQANVDDLHALGRLGYADLQLADSWLAEAQIFHKDAQLAYLLAVDAHEDAFGERLSDADWPAWNGADATAETAGASDALKPVVRRAMRIKQAATSLAFRHEQRVIATHRIYKAYASLYEFAERELGDVLFMRRLLAMAEVEREANSARLHAATARLISATGELDKALVKSP